MKRFVLKNQLFKDVVYKTKNIVIQKIQEGKERKRCYIIGNGLSVTVNEQDKVINHDPFMREFRPKISEDCTVYAFYFTFECSGLKESSKEIANFVNNLVDDYDKIFLVGHSKCGLCLTEASHYCEKNIILVTISTPFCGTVIADKNKAEAILKRSLFIKIYNMIFSDHNVDRDIKPNAQFIQNMQKPFYEEHINIVSYLRKVSDCKSIIDLFHWFLDKIMKLNGDGLVPQNSQEVDSKWTVYVICSHAKSLKLGLEIIEKYI